MATDVEKLIVALEARTRAFENALNRANGVADRRARAIETRFQKMNKTLSSTFTSLGARVTGALGAALTVRELSGFIDSYTKIQNSLKVAGLAGEDLNRVYQQLYASAQQNAVPIESLATLYGRVAINQKELGVTSEQLVGLTSTVGKALKAQGSSAEEAQGALLQLAQALGSGKVQAEEYNSLIDGLPVLLQAAANGIEQAGGSVAKLTQLVKSGQISGKALFDGFAAGAGVIDEKLANASETTGQSLTKLDNALTSLVGRFGAASDASASFGSVVDRVVNYLNTVDVKHLADQIGAVVTVLERATSAVTYFLTEANKAAGIDMSKLGSSLLRKPGESAGDYAYRSFYGTSREEDAAKRVLEIEQKISDLRNGKDRNSPIVKRDIGMYERLVDELKAKQVFVPPSRPVTPTPQPKPAPMQGPPKPAFVAKPIDINDPKYKPAASGGGGSKAKKTRLDEYEREVKSVNERTAAITAQTNAQAALNPYINDYGFSVERASTAQDLLSAAQAAGIAAGKELKDINQLLSGNFDELSPKAREQAQAMLELADRAGQAAADSQRLADSQDQLRQAMEEWRSVSKDATKGFIDDLVNGKSAVDALTGALQKLGDRLLDGALDSLFGASGSNNWFTSLFSGMSTGGPVKAATGGSIRGPGTSTSDSIPAMLSDGEYVVNARAARQNRALLEAINSGRFLRLAAGGSAGSPGMPPASVGGTDLQLNFAPVINAPGADASEIAKLRQDFAKAQADFSGRVVDTVKSAQKRRVL